MNSIEKYKYALLCLIRTLEKCRESDNLKKIKSKFNAVIVSSLEVIKCMDSVDPEIYQLPDSIIKLMKDINQANRFYLNAVSGIKKRKFEQSLEKLCKSFVFFIGMPDSKLCNNENPQDIESKL